MVNGLKDGADAFQNSRDRAHELGLVLREEILRDAERAKDRLTVLGTFLETTFVRIVAENADEIAVMARQMTEAAIAAAKWFGFLDKNMVEKLSDLRAELADTNREIDKFEKLAARRGAAQAGNRKT